MGHSSINIPPADRTPTSGPHSTQGGAGGTFSELSGCCSDCDFFRESGPHRLERWRFAALKRLIRAGVIPKGRNRYNFTPWETAAELALLVGAKPPACRGSAWAFLRDQYDPRETPPHKSTRKADRRRQARS